MTKKHADTLIVKAAARLLEKFAREEGLSMIEIANKGGMTAPALSQIRHQKRNLTPDLGAKLAKSMNLTVEAFYLELVRHILAEQEEVKKNEQEVFFAGSDYLDGISGIMNSLEEGDMYWLVSIETPIEFGSHVLDEVLLGCVQKGCTINYVFPPLRYDDLLKEGSAGQDQNVHILEEHGDAELDKRFNVWRQRFARRYPDHGDAIEQCFQCYHASFKGDVWFAPFVKYILIERSGAEDTVNWLDDEAWLDVEYDDPSQVRGNERCALPLDSKVVYNLKKWCNEAARRVS